ncbi:Uncharacterised protein [Mycobacteroides abscessus subsp. massiliense]|nr:Uncharacterised protein [Mycobacteroides abscessus subsp. massiliense]
MLTTDEEGGLAVLPALKDVGASGFLAYGVQSAGAHQRLEFFVFGTHLRAGANPVRLALDRGLGVADFQPQQLAGFCHTVAPTGSRPSSASKTEETTWSCTSSTVTSRPSSADRVVTPASVMPHATMGR